MEPISKGFLGEAWGQLDEGRGQGVSVRALCAHLGLGWETPRNLRCQRPICHPPHPPDKSGLILPWKPSRVGPGYYLSANPPGNQGLVALPSLSFPSWKLRVMSPALPTSVGCWEESLGCTLK